MKVRRAVNNLLDVFNQFLKILSWFETWVPSLVALGIIGFWLIFSVALSIPNPWRFILMWGSILGLAIFTPER